MDSFLVLLLGIAGVAIAVVTKVFIWLTGRSYEKLKEKRTTKCSYPCQPCECGEDHKLCDDVDICARKD